MSNATDPYRIAPPALLSLSGGRTSAFMLRQVLDAYDGVLPDGLHVGFANTGKEKEPTLRFVHECQSRWGVRVHWLEFRDFHRRTPVADRFAEVGYNSASRAGEPFDLLLANKTALPSGIRRWCTEYLKVKVLFDFAETIGLGKPGQFAEIIGLRADEKNRIDRMRHDARNKARHLAFPMSIAGVIKRDIFDFWKAQDFDLELERGFGNCDQCPFVGDAHRVARAQRAPAECEWWGHHEIRVGHRFGRHFTFAELLGLAASAPALPLNDAHDAECGTWCRSDMA